MYPGTQFNWIDQSFLREQPITVSNNAPLFMSVNSFDKGPEDFQTVFGNNFTTLYGKSDFFRHGQNSIQTKRIIDAGARLFVKRVVAPDSALANLVILAKVKAVQKEVQRTDENGNLLYYTDETKTATTTEKTAYKVMDKVYLDADGNKTTTQTDTPVFVAQISYEAQSITNVVAGGEETYKDIYKRFKAAALDLMSVSDDSTVESVFPVFIIADVGRGASVKAVRITPDYNTSRGSGHMFYTFATLENSVLDESFLFTFNPNVIYSDTSYRLSEDSSVQTVSIVDETVWTQFVEKLADITSMDTTDLAEQDILFGKTNKGADIESIIVDAEGVDLQAAAGVGLAEGSNGIFGDAPASKDEDNAEAYEAWAKAIADVYAGNVTDEVYDVDEHMICAIFDADFPKNVKEAMGELATFRKDCVFFRDIGIGKYTFAEIKAAVSELPEFDDKDVKKFVADFVTSYQVKDPNTQKNIEVTALYDFAPLMVDHIANNANAPTAGTYNNFILRDAIKGTVNYTPRVTPKVNQKQALEDLHCNYAIFQGDDCVMQTSYTSQKEESQLSYVNNVLAIQSIMRVVRKACPAQRFSLSNGSDLSDYAKAVNNVLDKYKAMFDILEFEYTANSLMAQQKIFYASIRFAFLNWAQSEIFDLYAINND